MSSMTLQPAMPPGGPVDWPGALWVGELDVSRCEKGTVIRLANASGYRAVRLLVRYGRTVLGFVESAISTDELPAETVEAARFLIPDPLPVLDAEALTPSATIVVCTRNRPELLRLALRSLLQLDYPDFDIVIVDNAPSSTATQDLVESEFTDIRVRLVVEPTAGLANARNRGLLAARGELVAFTDDDVLVDPAWLRELAAGFSSADDVSCVTGLVPSGELRTAVQRYFDGRVTWSSNLRLRTFRLSQPPHDLPMFPFSVGEFGTGANFAVRKSRAIALGGFDTCFGVGTRTGGGEDLDYFTRVLFSGEALLVQPSALVWHRHRSDVAALRSQARGYGVGLGAWLTKVALDPPMRRSALRRAPRALLRLLSKAGGTLRTTPGEPGTGEAVGHSDAQLRRTLSNVGWHELRCVLLGPGAYLAQRRSGEGPLPATGHSALLVEGDGAAR